MERIKPIWQLKSSNKDQLKKEWPRISSLSIWLKKEKDWKEVGQSHGISQLLFLKTQVNGVMKHLISVPHLSAITSCQ